MNKPFFQTIAMIILLTGISGKGICQSQMTMITAPNTQEVKIGLTGSGTVIIDWGAGKKDNHEPSDTSYSYYHHTYSDTSSYNIIIIGDVKYMDCNYNQIISLDVSKNIELTHSK